MLLGRSLGRNRRRSRNAIWRRRTVGRHRSRRRWGRDNPVAAGRLRLLLLGRDILLHWCWRRWWCSRVSTGRRHWWLLLRVRSGGRHWTLVARRSWRTLGLLLLGRGHASRRRRNSRTHRWLLPLALLHLESLMSLLASPEFSRLQLLQVELLPFLNQLLPLVLQTLPLALHRRFEFFKVSQFNFQLLHLCLHQQRDQTFNLPLLYSG